MTVSHVRMDNRLIHGQILVSWKAHIPINHLIVTNDVVANDPLQKTILNAVAPIDAKVSILTVKDCVNYCNKPESSKEKIFIIAKLPEDGLALVKNGLKIETLNLGNQAFTRGAKKLSKSVYLTESGVKALKELHNMGVRITCRMMPTDEDVDYWTTIEEAYSEWL